MRGSSSPPALPHSEQWLSGKWGLLLVGGAPLSFKKVLGLATVKTVKKGVLGAFGRPKRHEFVFGRGGGGFKALGRSKEAFDKRLGKAIPPWTHHDSKAHRSYWNGQYWQFSRTWLRRCSIMSAGTKVAWRGSTTNRRMPLRSVRR
jgi:hypothetical protein